MKVLYLSTPCHTNGGDLAIAYAAKKWLSDNFEQANIVELCEPEVSTMLSVLKKVTRTGDLIFLHGGGNLGDWYDFPENLRRLIIEKFPKNKIVLFSQSMFFSNTIKGMQRLKESQEIYSKHDNLTLLLRDELSYKLAKDYFPLNKTYCFPDMVFYCDNLLNKENVRNGNVLLCLRNDIERKLSNDNYLDIISTIDKFELEYAFQDTHMSNMRNDFIYSKSSIGIEERSTVVMELIQRFANYELVITDRFHGLIFSYITNTPCIVLNSADHKIEEGFKWISDANFMFWVGDDYNQIPVLLEKALKVSPVKKLDFKTVYFDKLKDLLFSDQS